MKVEQTELEHKSCTAFSTEDGENQDFKMKVGKVR